MERRWLTFWLLVSACGNHGSPAAGPDFSAEGDAGFISFPSSDAALADTTSQLPASSPQATPPPPAADAGFDAPPPSPPFDAGPDGICAPALSPGSLVIDELMIASVAGTGDYGEWLEVASGQDCAIDLIGLHGECPKGNKVITFDVPFHFWLPAKGTFIVADSSDPAINHDLPGAIIAWSGEPGDVLRNEGTTVTLLLDGTIIDSIVYPNLRATPGVSISFPSGCSPPQRADWTMWQPSITSWFPGYFGTPNAPNSDVQCP